MNPTTKQQLNGQAKTQLSVFESQLLKSLALMNHHLYEQTQAIKGISEKMEAIDISLDNLSDIAGNITEVDKTICEAFVSEYEPFNIKQSLDKIASKR